MQLSHEVAENGVRRALAYAHAHRATFVEELKEFVRFPSISAQPEHAEDMRRCAAWLHNHLRRIGLASRVVPTAGHPLVYAEWRKVAEGGTVLLYGHYDVQPPDPLAEWRSPPFEPTVRGESLYGRGACDDKGQLWAHVKALEAYLRTAGALPVNVVCVFEGEEEIGSTHLIPIVQRHRRMLHADVAVISDMRMRAPERPAITYALRGALSLELEVRGPEKDLHSGLFGGAVHNPLQALCEMLARLHDARGRVAIPGFYDAVRSWDASERAYLARTGPDDEEILRDAGAEQPWGEEGYTLYERTTLRPALTVNGIAGGYVGKGAKAVIPSRAVAKLGFRLVPDQDPAEVERLFRAQVARLTPPGVRSVVRSGFGALPALMDREHPAMRAAASAFERGFGCTPVFLRSGGTIPVVNALQEILQVPTLLMGLALPDDGLHGPNEKFHLPNLYRGIDTFIWLLDGIRRIRTKSRERPSLDGARRASAWPTRVSTGGTG